ncbi:MAG: TRAP transporter small permease [Desulfohalobiaceae bacterium]|nr:TRAP transporter small permease [Desulfohalobiaceae bacterium]
MLKKGLRALLWFEKGVLVAGLLGLALMAFVEVISRYFLNYSFTWFEEFSRYFCVFLTFLGASLGVKYGTHFCMDFVVTRVGDRAGHIMRLTTSLIAACLFSLVSWMAFEHALKLKKFGTTSAAMSLPMFWAYLPIGVFSVTLCIRFLLQGILHGRGFLKNEPLDMPIGVEEKRTSP